MKTTQSNQVLFSRLLDAGEKEKAKALARSNGVSVSAMIRLLILQAHRENWEIGVSRKRRAA